ncbi:Mur ligase family protein [Gammaproteobacteria bacterium]|nr:Mur ligase family protein [Gammaproteobacteria bacterium]
MKSLIYGYGVTGKSFERYLKAKNIEYDIFDDGIPELQNILPLDSYEDIYCSPGIPRKIFNSLKSLNKVYTDIDIFFKEDKSIKIGITGTNRKSTTAFHLSQLIEIKHSVNLIGNIGEPMLDHINNGSQYSVIELSSYQLDKMTENKLNFGVLLNIAPDHLDYHGSFQDYKNTKEKILESIRSSNESDPYKLYKWVTGLDIQLSNLKSLPYRFEKISESIINDSKSTNMHSLKYALKNAIYFFKNEHFVLVTCGNPSKEKFSKIILEEPSEILIYGSHKNDIHECINHPNKLLFDNLEEVLIYLKSKSSKQNILFSPGYPSGNDYKNFEERGSFFNQMVEKVFHD